MKKIIANLKKCKDFYLSDRTTEIRWDLSWGFFFLAMLFLINKILNIFPSIIGHYFIFASLVVSFLCSPALCIILIFLGLCIGFGAAVLFNVVFLPIQFVVLIAGALIAAAIFFSGRS